MRAHLGAPARAYHRTLPGYAPTPLIELPAAAATLGLDTLWCKLESSRLGLPSFKVLGASWAVERGLRELVADATTLVAATAGNHGRAVARIASWRGLDARIFIPASAPRRCADDIAAEGANVVVVDGTYDDAVQDARASIGARELLVEDCTDTDDEGTARFVIEGYATILDEVREQLAGRSPDVAVAQIGVGSFAAAVVAAAVVDGAGTRVIGVEPRGAACVAASLAAGKRVTIAPSASVLNGLVCGTPSAAAWPALVRGIDRVVRIDDEHATAALRTLAAHGVQTAPAGAAGLAGLMELASRGPLDAATALIFVTEGGSGAGVEEM